MAALFDERITSILSDYFKEETERFIDETCDKLRKKLRDQAAQAVLTLSRQCEVHTAKDRVIIELRLPEENK